MIRRAIGLAIATALGLGAAAHADAGAELNIGYTRFDDLETNAITGRVGALFTPYIGAEAEVNIGLDGDLDSAWGVFGKGVIPLSSQADLFARVGYADASSVAGGDGVSFGGGGQIKLGGRAGVRVEYTRYELDDDVHTISASLTWRLD